MSTDITAGAGTRPDRPPPWHVFAAAAMRLCSFVVDERERWLLWAPVFFGTGIAIYFALAFEPAAWIGAVILGVGIAVGILGRR